MKDRKEQVKNIDKNNKELFLSDIICNVCESDNVTITSENTFRTQKTGCWTALLENIRILKISCNNCSSKSQIKHYL
jgi:hypothetical protein